jgi:hypothetical protein
MAQNPSGRSRPAANPQAWEPTSDDDGGNDNEVDLPYTNAPIIRGWFFTGRRPVDLPMSQS